MTEAPTTSSPGDLRGRAISGFFWAYGAFLSQKVFVFVATLVLARLLEPSEFGIVAFALGVMAYLWGLTDLGMSAALIQRADAKEPGIASTVFWIGLAGALVLFGVSWAIAPFLASAGPDPMVEDVFKALAAAFVIGAFGGVPTALLQHSLEFRRLAIRQIGEGLVKGTVSIALAVAGAGVWALVFGQLSGALVGVVLLWATLRWRPVLELRRDALPSLARFGGGLTALNFVSEATRNADYLIIGVRLGGDALGLYYLAFRLPDLVVGSLSQIAWTVLFPLYSRMQDPTTAADPGDARQRLIRGYLKTVRLGSYVLFPLGFGLAALADPLVSVLFGDRWEGAEEPLALVALWAALTGITGMSGTVYKSLGRTGLMTANSLVYASIILPALWFAAGRSIVWVAAAHILCRIASLLYVSPVTGWVLGIPRSSTVANLVPAVVPSVLMGAAVFGIASALPAPAALVCGIPVGFAVYATLVRLLRPDDFGELALHLRAALEQVRRRKSTVGPPAAAAPRPGEEG